MAYEKTVWMSGDTITSARLNKMEQGIEDAYSSGGGDNSLPDWNVNNVLQPSFIKNKPCFNYAWIDTTIINTADKVTFTYDNETMNYMATITKANTDNANLYSPDTRFGIIIHNGINQLGDYEVIEADYEIEYAPNEGSDEFISRYANLLVNRINDGLSYEVSFSSLNIGDTIEAYVVFGIIANEIYPLDYKYFDYFTLDISPDNNGNTWTINFNQNPYFQSLDKLSSYLTHSGTEISLRDPVISGNVFRMFKQDGTKFVFSDNETGVFEYNVTNQTLIFYSYHANIRNENGTDICDNSFDELKYVKYITDVQTGIKMYTKSISVIDGAYFEGSTFDHSVPSLMTSECYIGIDDQVTMTRNNYTLTTVPPVN